MKTFVFHGFVRFGPNSCCKLFIYILCKRKIYVGHQGLHGTLFSSTERNFRPLTDTQAANTIFIYFNPFSEMKVKLTVYQVLVINPWVFVCSMVSTERSAERFLWVGVNHVFWCHWNMIGHQITKIGPRNVLQLPRNTKFTHWRVPVGISKGIYIMYNAILRNFQPEWGKRPPLRTLDRKTQVLIRYSPDLDHSCGGSPSNFPGITLLDIAL